MDKTKNNFITFVSIHPGEQVKDWLADIGMTQKEFCNKANIHTSNFNEFIKGKRDMTDSLAQSLSTILGMDKSYWLGLQEDYRHNEEMLAIRKYTNIETEDFNTKDDVYSLKLEIARLQGIIASQKEMLLMLSNR